MWMVVIMNKVKGVIFWSIAFILIGWGNKLIPSSAEITDIGVFQVLGIDSGENGDVSLSACIENTGKDNGSKSSESRKSEEVVITSHGESYNECANGLGNYSDKIFIGGHVKNIILGEDICKDNFVRAIDYLSKASEIRLNSNIFISKGKSAKEFMVSSLSPDYKLSDKITNVNVIDEVFTAEENTLVADTMELLLSEDKSGVIQVIESVDSNADGSREFVLENSEEERKIIQFAGYALINDAKLATYLDIDASNGYDFIKNNHPKSNIHIDINGDIVGINFNNSKSKVDFLFEGDKLQEISIKTKVSCEVQQSSNGNNVFGNNSNETTKLVSRVVKNKIEKAIYVAKSYDVDYIKFGDILKMKHPYKWNKIKDDWKNIFKDVKISVEVTSILEGSHNVLAVTIR